MLSTQITPGWDEKYILDLYHELHAQPEIGFDLDNTVAMVKRELEASGVEYTERFGRGSVVATINAAAESFTIGIRADMDALPVQEINDFPYRSRIDGKMHACGHDAHTAMLLGAARVLKANEGQLACRVKLIFQPSEEGAVSGAAMMVANGVMDDIDIIVGQHVENLLESGKIGVCLGPSMAACSPIELEFFGQTAHASLPQSGRDALAMAVKAYLNIQIMLTREISPLDRFVCSVGALNAGMVHNVIPDYAKMKISLRTYDMDLCKFIGGRIGLIAAHAAEELGGTAKIHNTISTYPVVNDPEISRRVMAAAAKVVGADNIADFPPKMSSEDFAWYLTKKPGVFYRLGTHNEAKGAVAMAHNNNFRIDEAALLPGSQALVQFVLDNMSGIGQQ